MTKPKKPRELMMAYRLGNGTHVLFEPNLQTVSIYRGQDQGHPRDSGSIDISRLEIPDLIQALELWRDFGDRP
jgi:hypothetical protein